MIHASLLSNEELYRLNGTLPPERIEALLDDQIVMDQVEGVRAELREARGCFPGEDFAQGLLDKLEALAKRVRGENQKALCVVIEDLTQLQTTVAGNAEYGCEKIDSAVEMLAGSKS